MKPLIFCFFLLGLHAAPLEAYMSHQKFPIESEWKEEGLLPFDELMLSWNAARPALGKFLFYISVKTNEWSPWLLYASWGNEGQSSFQSASPESPVKVFQDALEVLDGKKATGFQIKIIAEGSASLKSIHGLHVYTNGDKGQGEQKPTFDTASIDLKIPGLSQMILDHSRHKDLCSPTSTAAVIRYLSKDSALDPVDFTKQVWDAGFDIFGNWVFNVAGASTYFGSEWKGWVERLNGFDDIYRYLAQGAPVVVSVRGPLPGSAQPYAKGHLMAVIGYNAAQKRVMCMDPAFPSNDQTHVTYDLSDFIQAWGRRGNVAYVFTRDSRLNLSKV